MEKRRGWQVGAVIAVSAIFFGTLRWRWFNLNHEIYFQWPWRGPLPDILVYGIAIAAAIPIFISQWAFLRCRTARLPIALLMLGMLGLMIGLSAVQDTPIALWRIEHVVLDKPDSGYFATAQSLASRNVSIGQMLANYPKLLPNFIGHANNKPPGLLIFCRLFMERFGTSDLAVRWCGILIGVIATGIVPATYAFIRYFTRDRNAAFMGAGFLALSPGPILFFPIFDQWYPIFTAALTIAWAMSIEKSSFSWAAVFGVFYGITLFISYLPMTLIFFLIGFTGLQLVSSRKLKMGRLALLGLTAIGTFAAFYLIVWLLSGFDPLATFRVCLAQNRVAELNLLNGGFPLRRPPGTIPWDLYDFALGSGWISFLLVAFYFSKDLAGGISPRGFGLAFLCILQFVVVGCLGLIPGETGRVWIFMLPMLMLPVGLALSDWKLWERLTVLAVLLILTAAVCQNLTFLT